MPRIAKTATPQAKEPKQKTTTTSSSGSFHPDEITLPAFRKLLKCYPTALEQVHRRKLLRKFQPKQKGSRSAKNIDDADLVQEMDLSLSSQADIKSGLESFIKLDKWRYEEMPELIAARRATSKGTDVMSKDELTRVMEWKTTHGHSRPMLMGMIKSNQDKLVSTCTSAVITALPTADADSSEAFPQKSLDELQPLRGVGTATASLILSIMTGCSEPAQQIPFYSDEVYLWLAMHDSPDMEPSEQKRQKEELKVRYNLNEYKELWDASRKLSRRLNKEFKDGIPESGNGEAGPISQTDIEKVAYVLRNIELSGYYADQDSTTISSADTVQAEEEKEHENEAKISRKRKGEDENKEWKRNKRE